MSTPTSNFLPYGRQWVTDEDAAAVAESLQGDFLTTGPAVARFEREFAESVGAKHAVAVCNATAALHLAACAADLGPGDRLVTSPNTFTASANCAAFVGATPDFADIDPVSYNAAFADVPWLTRPGLRPPARAELTSWHLYTAQFDFAALGRTRTEVMSELSQKWRVGTQVLYIPVHLQPWYRRTYGYGPGKCPVAEAHYTRSLSLPLFPRMTDADVARVIQAVRTLSRA